MPRPITAWSIRLALATHVHVWVPKRAKDCAGQVISWLVSLVLHLAVLFLFFLCSFAISRDNRTDPIGTIVMRLDAAGDLDLLDNLVALNGHLSEDDSGSHDMVLETRRGTSPLESAGSDTQETGADEGDEPEHFSRSARIGTNTWSTPIVIDLDRDRADQNSSEESAVQRGAMSRGKVSRTGQRRDENVQDQPAKLEGILAGREPEARERLAKSAGGTKESERAVDVGLIWLVRHQQADGSWSFQHGPDNPGELDCPMGATGLALLAFLGAGHTHQKGEYRSQVNLGLRYLVDHMVENNRGGWLQGTGQATMYVQGIGAIGLCEALSMTRDPALRRPAQLAIDFIVNAQDPEGGGWRYAIPQAGDTSVLGWQVMALQSATIAELKVPPHVFDNATRFLNSVEVGGHYGYTARRPIRHSTTAVGLLCRMYLGRGRDHQGMIRGMEGLSNRGPNPLDMYYSYYATQAMHHWGSPLWEKWNAVMRDRLVKSQAKSGDARGSWVTDRSEQAQLGGRLYTTCLSILTLEVYYRYLPLYRLTTSKPDETSESNAAVEPSATKSLQLPAKAGK